MYSFNLPITSYGFYLENAMACARAYQKVLLTGCVLFLLCLVRNLLGPRRKNFPPGPYGLPVVGYLPFLSNHAHLKLNELRKKYGDIFSLSLGSKTVVVLSGSDVIREAVSKVEFLGRPPHTSFDLLDRKSPFFVLGINVWREQRRFVVQSMKDLGLGKSKIENHVLDEINCFLDIIRSHNGQPFDLKVPLTPSMSNNICSFIFGERYDYNHPERIQLDHCLNEVSAVIGQTTTHTFMPWLQRVPFALRWMNLEKGRRANKSTVSILKNKISEHKKTLDPQNIRDYIDNYLVEMKSRKEKDPNTTLSDETLIGTVQDLFGAGSETVRTSILWCVYTVAAYPEVQKRIQKEILEVVGLERRPEFLDMKQMPYTHAVIQEIMRWKTPVPLSILRYTTADTTVGGYDIPKGTTILMSFWSVHHDPKLWTEPEKFMPERFLGPDGRITGKSLNYMPFSLGKRSCPGETMAYLEIFLYFTSLLQNFDIVFPEGFTPTFQARSTVTYNLEPYMVRFIPKK